MKRFSAFVLLTSSVSLAGIMGVPTNLDAAGATTGTSVNPPGWLEIFGPTAAVGLGDALHQSRYFIEVTGSTMDVMIFDPGASGARDFAGGSGTSTTFSVRNPAGTVLSSVAIGNDSAASQDHLMRLNPTNTFETLNSTNVSNVNFTGLAPGLYELRVTATSGNEGNFYGIDVRVSKTNTAHYNVYLAGATATPSGFLVGQNTSTGAPAAAIVGLATHFPYVTSGCSFNSSNFDGDSTVTASLADAVGNAGVAVPLSGDSVHTEAIHTIELVTAQNLSIDNYGIWTMAFDPGATNAIDWRYADFSGWSTNVAAVPREPVLAIRSYLPNGYAPVPGGANAVLPTKPRLLGAAALVSGPNPPQSGVTSRFTITTVLKNPSADALTAPAISVGQPPGVTLVSGTTACFVNGTATACTITGAGFQRGTIASLAAGSTLALRFDVNVTPAAAGLLNLTGSPIAPVATTSNSFATYTSAYSVNENVGPICNMVVNVNGVTPVVTAAMVDEVSLDGNHLSFRAAMQVGTIGFHVYGANDQRGHEPTQLTARMIAAEMPDSNEPLDYSVFLKNTNYQTLLIEEHSLSSEAKVVARISTADARLQKPRLSVKNTFPVNPVRSVARRPTLPSSSSSAIASAVKIEVRQPGLAFVSNAQIQSAGLILGGWSVPKLYHQGSLVPFRRTKTGFWFTAQAVRTQYTDAAQYILSTRGFSTPLAGLTRFESVPFGTTRVERNRIYFAKAQWNTDPWYWGLVRSDIEFNDPNLNRFDLPSAPEVQNSYPVRLRFVSRSGHRQNIEAWINQQSVGSIAFDGDGEGELTGSISGAQLRATGNELRMKLISVADSPDDVGLGFVYFDRLDIEGLNPAPQVQTAADSVVPYSQVIPSLLGVNYVVISPTEFLAPANQLAASKSALGMGAAVVNVDRIYDRYSAGHVEAAAIASFMVEAVASGVRYVVLLGDDTFDYRNFTGQNTLSKIPSLDGWDFEFGRVPSENRYADVDGDGLPDVAIGRIPAQNLSQANHLVQKIISVNSVVPQTHLAIVDQRGPNDSDFMQRAQALNFASKIIVDAEVGTALAKSQIEAALAQGPASIHYFGHGSPTGWSSNQMWTGTDSASTTPKPISGPAFQWACFSQWYQYLYEPSVGESLLLMQGGPSASFGPSGISNPEVQGLMSDKVYAKFYTQQLPLGLAIMNAKRELLNQSNSNEFKGVVEGWNLLGDPSSRAILTQGAP